MTVEFYRRLRNLLTDRAVVVATVVQVSGSVPREVGAKMLIWDEAQTYGTIGGGAGEAKVMQTAQSVLETGVKQFVPIDLSGATQREVEGVCGGWMQIWLERWSGVEAIELAQQILDLLEAGQTAVLITPFSDALTPELGSLSAAAPTIAPHPNNPLIDALLEPLLPTPTLLIVGAGHVAVSLAQVAQLAGFQVVVQDDRPQFAHPDRFPAQVRVETTPIAQLNLPEDGANHLFVALVTRGYLQDLAALEVLLKRSWRYLGMIGSQKRIRLVFKELISRGFDAERLQTIHAPIGLNIGALTPEEIAVSIAAELVAVRRDRS